MSVAQVPCTTPLNVSFRRELIGVNWDNWICLVRSVLVVNLRWTPSTTRLVRTSQLRICIMT
jgi:hypothetical protein